MLSPIGIIETYENVSGEQRLRLELSDSELLQLLLVGLRYCYVPLAPQSTDTMVFLDFSDDGYSLITWQNPQFAEDQKPSQPKAL